MICHSELFFKTLHSAIAAKCVNGEFMRLPVGAKSTREVKVGVLRRHGQALYDHRHAGPGLLSLPLYRDRCLVGVVAPSNMARSRKSMVDSV